MRWRRCGRSAAKMRSLRSRAARRAAAAPALRALCLLPAFLHGRGVARAGGELGRSRGTRAGAARTQRQGDKLRRAIDRLIDGFAEGLIAKHEFEPRIAQLRQRTARLEAEAQALRSAAEQARFLQLVIGKLSVFADTVRDRLEAADWDLRREIVCTLVKRIEVTDDVVRVIFRVEPGGSGLPEQHSALRHCQARRLHCGAS